jgi:hypothetical protein
METPMQPPPPEQPTSTQKTPKGYEIPVPTRDQVLGFFKKVAKPKKG